ncbi:MAG: hypothetical protein PHO66_07475 [Eubacteriales bacterium]|nr:hypothetical protein [Eubacteriales bacterium]
MDKQYSAIFFDWAGTAVVSEQAVTSPILAPMQALLQQGVFLVILTNLRYDDLMGGLLHTHFGRQELANLYLGVERGAVQMGFDAIGDPVVLHSTLPDPQQQLLLHELAFEFHRHLLWFYRMGSALLLPPGNLCRVDLLPRRARQQRPLRQEEALTLLEERLTAHGYAHGAPGLLRQVDELSASLGIRVRPLLRDGFLELSYTGKNDSVDFFIEHVLRRKGIQPYQCCFWGHDFYSLGDAIFGGDVAMITPLSYEGAFFDVSPVGNPVPANVVPVGGGVASFQSFLESQRQFYS